MADMTLPEARRLIAAANAARWQDDTSGLAEEPRDWSFSEVIGVANPRWGVPSAQRNVALTRYIVGAGSAESAPSHGRKFSSWVSSYQDSS